MKQVTINLSFFFLKQTYILLPEKLYISIKEIIRSFGTYETLA